MPAPRVKKDEVPRPLSTWFARQGRRRLSFHKAYPSCNQLGPGKSFAGTERGCSGDESSEKKEWTTTVCICKRYPDEGPDPGESLQWFELG